MIDIYLRNQPPPTETFDHKSFLVFLSCWIKPEHYLELGVRSGDVFREVSKKCSKATGVDISPIEFNLPNNANFFQSSTDSFFERLDDNEKFDMIFIDADHSYEQSLKDFNNSQKHLVNDGFIIMHDTYPLSDFYIEPNLCNDVYKTALFIKNNLIENFEILTLPFHPGLTIVKKINRDKQMIWK
jgi:hypothetical protein